MRRVDPVLRPCGAVLLVLLARATAAAGVQPVVIIGSGIGGLSCGCMLARYGRPVIVLESHEHAGGCAHAFERGGYQFDSGPSLWAGMSRKSMNPLRQVLDAVGEADSIDWVTYDGWGMVLPGDDSFFFKTGDAAAWERVLDRLGGSDAREQWTALMAYAAPGEPSQISHAHNR